ncbi:MAG TPA: hypothetical protein VKA31_09660 [Mariprofundaceae bacterium]|nr:hypothetical protein [Mariprofundaceae bacterium]
MLLLPILSGCLTQANQGKEAGQIVNTVHQAFHDRNWDLILPLYNKKFFEARSEKQWRDKLQKMTTGIGALKAVKPTFQQKDPRFGGDFYLYGFLLQYEKATISETLTIYKGINEDRMTISGHILKIRGHDAS